jgi:hypothetical protein
MPSRRSTLRAALAAVTLTGILAILPGAAASASSGHHGRHREPEPATYTVTVTNLTAAQYLTPPNFAAHDRGVDVFQVGRPASNGVQQVAENGGVPVLAAELASAIDGPGLGVSGVGADAPIGPGQSATFSFTTDARRLSLVAMLICTNDGFAGLDARALPRHDGQTRRYRVRAYDAGTEINTELRQDVPPAPFCGDGPGSGESNPALAEHGVVRPHRTLRGVGDLDPSLDWRGPVASVVITRED